jgi:hypothetical protein
MNLSDEVKALEAQNEAKKNQTFEAWMSEPMTRMALSMIPAGEHPDTLRVLLRTAFDRGFAVGVGEILTDVLGKILRRKEGERRP